jgi:putative tricarboxylic transport membrane protein
MRKGLIAASIVLIGLSMYGVIESLRLERTMQMGIGIGFLPFCMSLVIGSLSAFLLTGVLRGKIEVKEGPICEKGGASRVMIMVLLLMGYMVLIEMIGYVASTFLFFSTTIFFLGKRRIVRTLFTSAAFTFFLFAIFRLWLKSPLPVGFLGV